MRSLSNLFYFFLYIKKFTLFSVNPISKGNQEYSIRMKNLWTEPTLAAHPQWRWEWGELLNRIMVIFLIIKIWRDTIINGGSCFFVLEISTVLHEQLLVLLIFFYFLSRPIINIWLLQQCISILLIILNHNEIHREPNFYVSLN